MYISLPYTFNNQSCLIALPSQYYPNLTGDHHTVRVGRMYFETAIIKVTIQWKQPVYTTLLVSVRLEKKYLRNVSLERLAWPGRL